MAAREGCPVDSGPTPAGRLWPSSECPAVVFDRTLRAQRASRLANQCPQFHQGLIESPRSFSILRNKRLGELPYVLRPERSREHSFHVRVHGGHWLLIRKARHCSCCVPSDTG